MSNSSQQTNYTNTLPDFDYKIINGSVSIPTTITLSPIDTVSLPYQYSFDTSTFTTSTVTSGMTVGGVSSYTSGISTPLTTSQISALDSWKIKETVPFEDGFPEWHDFSKMCEEYPGLQKTLEHLKVFYRLCKDEWETTKKAKK